MNLLANTPEWVLPARLRAALAAESVRTVEALLSTELVVPPDAEPNPASHETTAQRARACDRLTVHELLEAKRRVAAHLAARPVAVEALADFQSHPACVLSTGFPALDSVLGGGVHVGEVTEAFGQSGVGKTQLAMRLAAGVAASSDPAERVVYIDTCNSFHGGRFRDILGQVLSASMGSGSVAEPELDARLRAGMGKVRIMRAFSLEALVLCLERLVRHFEDVSAEVEEPRLVVVDSVAAVVAPVLGGRGNAAGYNAMALLSKLLNELAASLGVSVFITNTTVRADWASGDHDSFKASMGRWWTFTPSVQIRMDADERVVLCKSPRGQVGKECVGIVHC